MSFGLGGPKDWSPLTGREKRELEGFLAFFENKTYRGWTFDYAYPGFFSFYHPDSDFTIFFTPDWSDKDQIDIQVARNTGESTDDGGDVPFTVRTAENLFAAVKPWLDKYHPSIRMQMGASDPKTRDHKEWSPLEDRRHRDVKAWGADLAQESYRGWKLDREFPSILVYFHPDSPLGVFFNPDWHIYGSVAINVVRRDSMTREIESAEVPFAVRSAENLFEAVKPWLDKYHPDHYKPRRRR